MGKAVKNRESDSHKMWIFPGLFMDGLVWNDPIACRQLT
uniref:Uncharacterized protein n=1 Tax=Anguilla anguilla TaxID=7936 RepID=A0A0E9PH80_ANGAN